MRIVFANQYVGPERYCPAFRPTHLARQWVKKGHEVTIVGASFSHLFHETPRFTGAVGCEHEGGVRYLMLRTPPYHGNGVGRALSMAAFVARTYSITSLIRDTVRPDLVIAGSVYGLDFAPCRRWARAAGARLVRDVRDLWPLTLTEVAGLPRWHPFVAILGAAERYSYTNADCVITTLPGSQPHMERRGLPRDRWRFVPQGVDVERWDSLDGGLPDEHAGTLAALRRAGRLVVGYAGSHGVANALGTLVGAARQLERRPVAFVLVGQGPEKKAMHKLAARMELANISWLPPVPRASLPALLASVDVAWLGWRRSRLYDMGISSNKVMDYLLAAKPVIQSGGADNDLVAQSGCGRSVPGEDPEALAAAIEWMLSAGANERARLGQLGRAHVVQHYPYPVIAERYLRAITPGVDLTFS